MTELVESVRKVLDRRDSEGTDDLDMDLQAALAPVVARMIAEAKAEALRETLLDLDGETIRLDDPDGFAGTYMRVVYGGDTGRPEDWKAAYHFSHRIALSETSH